MLMIVELSRSRAPWVRKFGCLCIQEIGVLTNSSERQYVLRVSRCEISLLIARNPRHILSVLNGIGNSCYGRLTAEKIDRRIETHQ